MRLGLNLGYWGMGNDSDNLVLAKEADKLGYSVVWAAEAYGSDAATVLAFIAAQTEKIDVGSAVFQIPGRTPANTAMTAATLDTLSNGRFRLGLGVSGPQVSEGWHGVRFGKQLARTRDYVAVLRMALARERLEYSGETLELPLPDGPGKALKLTIGTVQDQVPIYIAAIGPKNTQLTGEIADGVIPTLFSPEHVSVMRDELQIGVDRAGNGKTLADIDIAPTVQVYVSDNLEDARNLMRPFIGLYVGGMGSREQNFYNQLVRRYGFEDAAQEVQDLYLDGKKDEAMAALPDELIDMVAICGPADHVRERIAAYREAGVGTLGVSPVAFTREERITQLRLIAELAAD